MVNYVGFAGQEAKSKLLYTYLDNKKVSFHKIFAVMKLKI